MGLNGLNVSRNLKNMVLASFLLLEMTTPSLAGNLKWSEEMNNKKQETMRIVQDTLRGKKLLPEDEAYIKKIFEKTLKINDTIVDINSIRVDSMEIFKKGSNDKILDKDKDWITDRSNYEIRQNHFLKLKPNISSDEKYSEKMNKLEIEAEIKKIMKNNRHLEKIEGLLFSHPDYTVELNGKGNKLILNGLLALDVTGNDKSTTKINDIIFSYDRELTKKILKDKISKLPYSIDFDEKVLENLPYFMDHIDLWEIIKESIKWNQEAKLVDNDDLSKRTRTLSIDGKIVKELQDFVINFDDEAISLDINNPLEAKEGESLFHEVLGFPLKLHIKTKNNALNIKIPNEWTGGMKEFKKHIVKNFEKIRNKLNKTHLWSLKEFSNLKKVLDRKPWSMIVTTKTDPEIINIDPSLWFVANITNEENPLNLICDIDLNWKISFVDFAGRPIPDNYIKYGKNTAIEKGKEEEWFKLKEFQWGEKNITWVEIEGNESSLIERARVSFNDWTNELVYRNPKTNKEIMRIGVKTKNYWDVKKWEEAGYEYDENNNTVNITADAFDYLLDIAPKNHYSVAERVKNLGISDTKLSKVFKRVFDEKFEWKKELPWVLINWSYAKIEDEKNSSGKNIKIERETPEEVKEIVKNIRYFTDMMFRVDNMDIIVSPDGNIKKWKNNRSLLDESVGWESWMGRKIISGLDTFDKENEITYTLVDGQNNVVPIVFTVDFQKKRTPLSLKDEHIDIDGVPYDLHFEQDKTTLYLIPQKEK